MNRKKAGEALLESEQRFMTVFYASPDAMFHIEGRTFVDCNAAAVRMMGRADKKDFLMMHPSALSPAAQPDGRNSREKADEMIRSAFANGFHQFEWTHRRADGEDFPAEVSLTPITMRGKTILHCVVRDLTAQKRSAAALAQAQGLSSTVLDSIDDHILIIDSRNLQIRGANRAFLASYGLTREQVLGRTCHEVTHGKTSACSGTGEACPIQTLQTTGKWARIEHLHHTPNGEERRVEIAIHPIKNPDGEVEQIVHISRDITEARRKEETEREMQKLESLGTLAGGIAHDFNNILTAILGNLSLLTSMTKADGEARSIIKESEDACAAAKSLSNQLLTFAKGGNPIVSIMDLRPVLMEAAAFASRGSNARCVFDLGEDPLAVNIDRDQISRVIQNLILNSIQAMPQGGDITFMAAVVTLGMSEKPYREAGRFVRLTVEDQGPGIPPAHLTKIFDPYFSTKGLGRGLGLATSYSIMTKHGGNIGAVLKPGSGACFILHFPAASPADAPSPREAPTLTSGSGRVLIMEDDGSVAKVLKRMLERIGYEAEPVADGPAALDAYARAMKAGAPYDAVILDLTIRGGMGGKEVLVRLAALDPAVKALVSSGYANDPIMAEYASYGFRGILAKPYRLSEVSEALRRILGAASVRPDA